MSRNHPFLKCLSCLGCALVCAAIPAGCTPEPGGGPSPNKAADTRASTDPTAPGYPRSGSAQPSTGQRPPGPAPEGMVWIPSGEFWMGLENSSMPDAGPVHRVRLDGFWMDRTEVTNEQFARFVKETGYKTVAEITPLAKDFPGAPPENLVAGSIVFNPPEGEVSLEDHYSWWRYQKGASWRHPEGPKSDLKGREKHPVVQVCYDDAQAYARWAGKRLPTEAEWEYAARGGLEKKQYVWGDDPNPGGKQMANIWQGNFPKTNTAKDGYKWTAPVGSYPPNGYGLVDMAGNVWEWCSDWYRPDYFKNSPPDNPQGPPDSFDPSEPGTPKRIQKGGSLMCAVSYCVRFMPGTRGKGSPDSGNIHVGFRCVRSAAR